MRGTRRKARFIPKQRHKIKCNLLDSLRCVGAFCLYKPPLCQGNRIPCTDDHVIQHTHINQLQRIREAPGDGFIIPAGFRHA